MNALMWALGVAIALLAAINAVFWWYCIREVGDPQMTMSFLFKLTFNKWFILALASAFAASLLSYAVLSALGVIAGRFFLTIQMVAIVLTGVFVLGERPSWEQWAGIVLIIAGGLLLGR